MKTFYSYFVKILPEILIITTALGLFGGTIESAKWAVINYAVFSSWLLVMYVFIQFTLDARGILMVIAIPFLTFYYAFITILDGASMVFIAGLTLFVITSSYTAIQTWKFGSVKRYLLQRLALKVNVFIQYPTLVFLMTSSDTYFVYYCVSLYSILILIDSFYFYRERKLITI